MKRFFLLVWMLTASYLHAQVQAYYNDVDLSVTGNQLKDNLAVKIINTHTHQVSYSQLWDVYIHTDSAGPGKVYLIYGWDDPDSDGDCHNDLTRNQTDHGGSAANCDYNREHVYPKSLGTPDLGTSGPGSDAHHVRPSDVSMNSWRGNKKFTDDSGHAHAVGSDYWYPGDSWKGDVARIIMYMYLRYGSQCLPRNVGQGTPVTSDPDMIDLFLQWNAQDPPSPVEDRRNDYLEGLQGNRNPFVDNPYLATLIWGGPTAQDRWNMAVESRALARSVRLWPNPAHNLVHIRSDIPLQEILLTDAGGRQLRSVRSSVSELELGTGDLPAGMYYIVLCSAKARVVKPLIIE